MRFIKMHGAGNDYVYINGFEQAVDNPQAMVQRIADRHLGVGGDGMIIVCPPGPGIEADARMRMFNADGSEAEMCGNGIRCACKLVHDQGLSDAKPMRIQTGHGVLSLDYQLDEDQKVCQVTVDMGCPILAPDQIPVRIGDHERIVNYSIREHVQWPKNLTDSWIAQCGLDQRVTCLSMGNPHAVLYCNNVAAVPLDFVGPVLEQHPMFPNRINVHFVQVNTQSDVTMRTWERGSGITMACGTGACAVCVAGVLSGRSSRQLVAHLPGGDLTLDWNTVGDTVYMTGPAVEVFEGKWPG